VLGSGTGIDVYVCSALVGAKGKVIGVDMTDNQLEKVSLLSSRGADRDFVVSNHFLIG